MFHCVCSLHPGAARSTYTWPMASGIPDSFAPLPDKKPGRSRYKRESNKQPDTPSLACICHDIENDGIGGSTCFIFWSQWLVAFDIVGVILCTLSTDITRLVTLKTSWYFICHRLGMCLARYFSCRGRKYQRKQKPGGHSACVVPYRGGNSDS